MTDRHGRYHKVWPDSEPSRFREVIDYRERLQIGDKYRFPAIHQLRRNKEFREDKRHTRRIINVPPDGYGVREAREKFAPLARAYLNSVARKGGSRENQNLAGAWAAILSAIHKFADKYPLAKSQPMPLHIAFNEIIYRRPKTEFRLQGYYQKEGPRLRVLLEDAKTDVPQPIQRLVTYKYRGDDNEFTKQIRFSNQVGDSGCWEFRKIK